MTDKMNGFLPKKGPRGGPQIRPNLRVVDSIYWGQCDSGTVLAMLELCTKRGCAIMFGRTSDGGALSLCILDGDKKIKEYPRSDEAVQEIYTWLRDDYVGD
jgi:putative hemolysin